MNEKYTFFVQGLAMVMHKNFEGPTVFEMLNKALEVARREKRVTEERNIRILIAQMHLVKVSSSSISAQMPHASICYSLLLSSYLFTLH